MFAIEICGFTKVLKQREILKDINLTIEKGTVNGLYGHNGSGKSMLMRAIAGLIYPTKGKVTVFGQELGKDISFPDSMGLMIENVGFWPYYTGFENLKTLASIQNKISDDEIRKSLERVGLDPSDKRTYHKYSLGMKQRLGVAQAVMEKPNLILLDEPTNALDDEGTERIRQIVRQENERGATIVLASHNKEDLTLCDHFYKMNDGRISEKELPI